MSDNLSIRQSGCVHLKKYKQDHGTIVFGGIVENIVYPEFDSSSSQYKYLKLLKMKCWQKNCTSTCILHTCLFCFTLFCYDIHLKEHVEETGHSIAIDVKFGNTYCSQCDTFVYDDQFLSIVNVMKQLYCYYLSYSYIPPSRIPLYKSDIQKYVSTYNKLVIDPMKPNSYIGLRGLMNHGNTCYVNSVLQMFAHIPLMRNSFFSTYKECKKQPDCFQCEIRKVFEEFYNGKTEPISTGKLLKVVWSRYSDFQGNKQQDAHEFFSVALNMLHEDYENSIERELKECPCISHDLFCGSLKSKLGCKKCLKISTTIDPFLDISLDICGPIEKHNGQYISIEECLEEYTHPESIDVNCSNCKSDRGYKQLTFYCLPLVLVIQLKRFAAVKNKGNDSIKWEKVSAKVTFPDILDLTKFKSSNKNQIHPEKFPDTGLDENRYRLNSVIEHIGSSPNRGHYSTYITHHQNWFKCDDVKVTLASIEEVLSSEAYLLVYEKVNLDYFTSK